MSTTTILLVESNALVQKTIQQLAASKYCPIAIAETGAKALQKFEQLPYDLVLMNVVLSDTTGYAVTRRMRRYEVKNHRTPAWIVGIAADPEKKECGLGIRSGMNIVYSEPLTDKLLTILLDTINSLSMKSIIQEALIAQADPNQVIDLELGAHILDSTPEIAKRMIRELVNVLPDDLKELQAAFSKKDYRTLQRLTHYIRVGSISCGTLRLKNAATLLEKRIINQSRDSDIITAYQRLSEEINAVIQDYHLHYSKE